jgi:hypothetical protein
MFSLDENSIRSSLKFPENEKLAQVAGVSFRAVKIWRSQ